jgi:lysine 6-dehydrogenase
MAQAIVRDLVESKGVSQVIIAGLELREAEKFAARLKTRKAEPAELDARDKDLSGKIDSLEPDVLVNSTWYEHNLSVMSASIKAGVHYVDLGGLYHMTRRQLNLNRLARRKEITCVLGMGSTPGIMNLLGAHGARKFRRVKKVDLRCGSKSLEQGGFATPYSIKTVLDEFTMKPVVLRDGHIKELRPLTGGETFEFPDPIGKVSGYYTLHSELATMPKTIGKGVREMDFIVAYDPSFTHLVSTLVRIGLAGREKILVSGTRVAPYDVLAETIARLPRPERDPEDAEGVRVDIKGTTRDGAGLARTEALVAYHRRWGLSSGTADTGIPASIIAQWIASGKISRRGAFPPELCVDIPPFFKELNIRDRGIKVYESINESKPEPLF